MNEETNILILSCGSRNKIVQYFREELKGMGSIIATDCSELAPALYEADKHFIVPRIDEENYLETILSICEANNIKAVFSLIDPEISILAKHKQEFLNIGTTPIVPELDAVETCFNKYKMFNFLKESNFNVIKSYIKTKEFFKDIEEKKINYPVFVKPVTGSASLNINRATCREEVESLFNRFDNLMIQEYMGGKEYGIDAYIDLVSGKPVEIFIKEKLKMRAGETDKSVSIKNKEIFELVEVLIEKAGYMGIIDIDIFEVRGKYYISEVNPRFGGGFPHAYKNGMNVPKMIVNNLKNKKNDVSIGEYKEGNYMMKYNEVKFL